MTRTDFLATKDAAIAAVDLLKLYIAEPKKNPLTNIEIETFKKIVKNHSKDFDFFTIHVLGFNRYPKTHSKWCKDHQKDFYKKKNFIRLKPRGTGKTTIYGIAFILWLWAAFSPKIRIFYSSANAILLAEVYDTLKRILAVENESFYSFVFGITLDKTAKNTDDIINITGRGDAKGFSLTLRPAGSSTAGVHPNVILIDDPCDKDDRTSQATRKYKKMWADTLRPLLHPMKLDSGLVIEHFMVIATRWHMDDVNKYFMDQNEKLPDSDKFDIDIESLEHPGTGKNNFPEIYTQKKILVLRGQMDSVFFSCQMNNVVLPEGTKIFDLSKFHFANIKTHYHPDGIDISQGSNYCFIDPSKGKKESDFPATIFVNKQGKRLFIFDAIVDIKPFADVLDDVIRRSVQYNVIQINFEDNGTNLIEEGLAERIKKHNDLMERLNLQIAEHNRNFLGDQKKFHPMYYATIKGKSEGRNKVERIRNMQPVLVGGGVIFREDYRNVYQELINQIEFFPAWGHDDFPDVVEKAIRGLVQNDFEFGVFKAS